MPTFAGAPWVDVGAANRGLIAKTLFHVCRLCGLPHRYPDSLSGYLTASIETFRECQWAVIDRTAYLTHFATSLVSISRFSNDLEVDMATSIDDYTADTITTGLAVSGGSTTGQLEYAGDKDWFAINLAAGQQYSFNLDSVAVNGLPDPYLRLYGSNGSTLMAESDDADGLNSRIDHLVAATGTYYLEASSGTNGNGTGSYLLSVSVPIVDDFSASATTTGRVDPGGSTTGQLDVAGGRDWFAIDLVVGKQYTFNLDSGSADGLPDPYLRLYGSDSLLITSNDDTNELNSEINFVATATGTFYLGVRSSSVGGGTGTYVLSASLPIADDYAPNTTTSGRLAPGGSATGQLEFVEDKDWFAINLVAGQQYNFTLDAGATNGLNDPFLSLYSSSGKLIISNDDSNGSGSEITYTATDSGVYYLGASSPNGTGSGEGSYTLSSSHPTVGGITIRTGTEGNDTFTADGDNTRIDGGAGINTVDYAGSRNSFAVTHNSDGTYSVVDSSGTLGSGTLNNIQHLGFTDVTVSLTVQAKATSISTASLNALTELYVAYFNRVPDAEGLSYWIDQLNGGQSLKQIGGSFYAAGIQYASLTGFSDAMTNADFVTLIYKNALGRSGDTAPPLADVNYWASNLATGTDSRGTLIETMLGSAHSFKGDATWGWVADLLDNKISVGKIFAVDNGLTYNTPADSITHGMDIATAVTSDGTADAIKLIGITDAPL